jgi:hypothetical protein
VAAGFVADTRQRLGEVESRITSLELQFDTRPRFTTAAAAELALVVKNIAFVLAGKGVVGSYAKVYSALYRRFGVSAYPNIYRERYAEVITWLKQWYDEAVEGKGGAADELARVNNVPCLLGLPHYLAMDGGC